MVSEQKLGPNVSVRVVLSCFCCVISENFEIKFQGVTSKSHLIVFHFILRMEVRWFGRNCVIEHVKYLYELIVCVDS